MSDHEKWEGHLAAYRAEHVPLYNQQPLKFGIFSANASGNIFMTKVPTSYEISWDHTTQIARQADELGFEAFIPVARFRGFGGDINWNGTVYETLTYAAGIAAATKNIMTFATVHAPLVHPVLAAKAITTVDHISGGRAGLNLVMGWYEKELRMMGTELRGHEDRYGYGAEWIEVANQLWTRPGSFDYHGKFLDLEGLEAMPKPIQPRPVILNAGASTAGQEFAARYADFNFASFTTPDQARRYSEGIRAKAAEHGRDIGVITLVVLVCRDTEEEAKAAYQAIIDQGDWEAADNFMRDLNIVSGSFGEHFQKEFLAKSVAGSGGHSIVGTPEQVVEGLLEIRRTGIDCVLLGMVDYKEELKYFGERVMPLLKQAGLRI
jgi:dimethylsulfone monooxygenase